MPNVIDTLQERGFIEDMTHATEIHEHFSTPGRTGYIGFDPTASSLHVGSLVPIMSLAHMQRHGHRPIALVGGGTGLVGDPSGKTEMRQILTESVVEENAAALKRQLSRFIAFGEDGALLANNADWLTRLRYIPFLRDIGRHFSVNRMIKAESYRMRLESEEGLSFIEFNYMLLQAFDFLTLYEQHGCRLQMGGSDQWGNIVAGIELIRRTRQASAYGVTFPLITTAGGAKMGKTAQGAVWLDAERTSPYEYYQYWVNCDDPDVARFLALFTFLPMKEIRDVERLEGAERNPAKTVLAFEATRIAHGLERAQEAHRASVSAFGDRPVPRSLLPSSEVPRKVREADDSSIPHSELERSLLEAGIPAFKLFHMVSLAATGGAARRLLDQGGGYVNGKRIESFEALITLEDAQDGEIRLRAGKKRYHTVRVV